MEIMRYTSFEMDSFKVLRCKSRIMASINQVVPQSFLQFDQFFIFF